MKKVKVNNKIPLLGLLQIGIIDRGSNLVQIRPTSLCNLNCKFCSTSSGVQSKIHSVYYEVGLEHLLNWVKKCIDLKGEILLNLDSVGEIFTYPEIYELIKRLDKMRCGRWKLADNNKSKGINEISMQTNGMLMDFSKVKDCVDRINLSVNSLDKEKSRYLAGCSSYDIEKIKKLAIEINNSDVELLIAPVWIPGVNDDDIADLIKFCKELGCKIGIQKYEIYKHSRKIKGAKKINWFGFYKQLEKWENEFGVKLKIGPKDFEIKKAKRFPIVFGKNDKISVEIVCKGWYKGQMIGKAKNRCITVNDCDKKVGDRINVKILENKNNIYLGGCLDNLFGIVKLK